MFVVKFQLYEKHSKEHRIFMETLQKLTFKERPDYNGLINIYKNLLTRTKNYNKNKENNIKFGWQIPDLLNQVWPPDESESST